MRNNNLSKILSRQTLFIAILIVLALALVIFIYFTAPKISAENDLMPPIKNIVFLPAQEQVGQPTGQVGQPTGQVGLPTGQVGSGVPVRLKIPSLNIDSAIEYVGLTSDGEMDVPKDRANVAWYDLGSRPGENGSAVIAGHYGRWKNGDVAVFDNLDKLKFGDKILIESNDAIISFVVRETKSYQPEADATEVFFSSDGKAHLNIVTCEGEWNKISKSYAKRLVVFADKE